ncbi:MAG: hypothetical protein AAF399_15925 [Bacteroidota bacterium]
MDKIPSGTGWGIGAGILVVLAIGAIGWINWGAVKALPADSPSAQPSILEIRADTLPAWQTGFMLAEIKEYRTYIEQERREYQSFLTRTYSTLGILISALAGVLAFLGVKTLQDLRTKGMAELEAARTAIETETRKKLEAELGRLMKQKLAENEDLVGALQQIARKQVLWEQAKIRMVVPNPDLLPELEKREIAILKQGKAMVNHAPYDPAENLDTYNVIIHCYFPNRSRQKQFPQKDGTIKVQEIQYDGVLVDQLLPQLSSSLEYQMQPTGSSSRKHLIPVILYDFHENKGSKRIDPHTMEHLKAYELGLPANSPITLFSNTYDAITFPTTISTNAE